MSATPDDSPLKRKLAVILASDVAGYSALVAADEEQTIRRFTDASRIMRKLIAQQSGRVFNTAGDAILAEFDSPVNAVRCAIDVQDAFATANEGYTADRIMLMRIGIAIVDVIVAENADLLGDGVNIAARLQTLAQPGGICISQDVQQMVQNKIALGFEDIGPQSLKNIPRPVHAFRLRSDLAPAMAGLPAFSMRDTGNRRLAIGIATALFLVLGGALFWQKGERPGAEAATATVDRRTFNAATVPLVTTEVRERLVGSYTKLGGHKALAISNDGDFHGIAVNADSEQTAIERARESCEKDATATHKRPCFIYAIGSRVLVDPAGFLVPPAGEIPSTPTAVAFGTNDTPLNFMQQGRRLAKEYPEAKASKALAMGSRGETVWGAMATGATDEEAKRRALEFCGFRTRGPCIVYALGTQLMTLPPATRKIVGVLSFSTDKSIPASERDRLAAVYAKGNGWQALARGANGTWTAAIEAKSEEAAVEDALAQCGKTDRDCKLYAVGRFLVE